ncbi:MAG: YbaB/EbfC family nucleoid-associated protein [Planctomycetaceae bacterium]|nr:YbaB/EbfC family nucleoid-associated protein [Planctomycetaceae bacterium]MCE5325523.1 YbaB/EbfC family nucleoid-associated protein [Planctomycetaceae bacterium]
MFGNLGKMMKMAQEMKSKLPEVQAQIEASQHSASAGGDAVSATVNGRGALIDIRIDPKALAEGDAALLEDLVKAAVSAAQNKAVTYAAEVMKKLATDMGLPPGMEGMLG